MFNTTHTFVGIAIARAGTGKWARNATLTAVIASNFPDIDSIAGFWGTAAYLDHHRGITHSLIGVPIFALVVSGVMYLFSENFWRTYAIALIAMATHPALDYLNSYGVRPFLPWSNRWYYGDVVFIFDAYLDVILLLGIVAGWLWTRRRALAAISSLVLALGYIAIMVELHHLASSKVEAVVAKTRGAENWAVLPEAFRPLDWEGMIESETEVMKFPVDALPQGPCCLDPNINMKRSNTSELITEAASAESAAALLRFARFPVARVGRLPSGYLVTFLDFRFYREATNSSLAAEVTLDQSLRVTHEQLSFVQRIN
jgi:inner membrane protein